MKIYLFILFVSLNVCTNLRKMGKNNKPVRTNLKQKPKSRKLLLDWFDSDDEQKKHGANVDESMKKVMDLMKLADSFKTDPNFNVNVEISYRNPKLNHSDEKKNERTLRQLKSKYPKTLKLIK